MNLTVRAGEIVGLAGVEGNGQREPGRRHRGHAQGRRWSVHLGTEDVTGKSPHHIHAAGVGHVPEDREKHGLVGGYSIADNLSSTVSTSRSSPTAGCATSGRSTNAEAYVKGVRHPHVGHPGDRGQPLGWATSRRSSSPVR